MKEKKLDIHFRERKLNQLLKWLDTTDKVSSQNKNLIGLFIRKARAFGLSNARIVFYLEKLKTLLSYFTTNDLDKLTKEDVEDIITKINEKDYEEWTKNGFKITLKKFLQIISGFEWNSKEYPESVKWLKVGIKNNMEELPENILTPQEIQDMIKSANNKRDQAMLSVLWEGGLRVGELCAMKKEDVEFNDFGVTIKVSGTMKGERIIPLISSAPFLSEWIGMHPNKKNPNAFLWKNFNNDKPIGYQTVRMILKEVADKCKIVKAVNPHSFRHSSATHYASKMTEQELKQFFGWRQSSKMASVYVHLSSKDLIPTMMKIHGLTPKEEAKDEKGFDIKLCPVCQERNGFSSCYCRRCGVSLNIDWKRFDERLRKFIDIIEKPEIFSKIMEIKQKKE